MRCLPPIIIQLGAEQREMEGWKGGEREGGWGGGRAKWRSKGKRGEEKREASGKMTEKKKSEIVYGAEERSES